jgi:HEAT repeat protein
MKKIKMNSKKLAGVAAIVICLLALGAYTITVNYKRPATDSEAPAMVKAADVAADREAVPVSPVPQPNAAPPAVRRPAAEDDAVASISAQAEPPAADEIRDSLEQMNSYRQSPSAEAVAALESFLDSDFDLLAAEAIEVLRFIALGGDQQEAVVAILKAKAADPSYRLRDRALFAAAEIAKEEMLPVVADYIRNPDEQTQAQGYDVASRALAIIRNQDSVPYLEELLARVKDTSVRRNCYATLAAIDSVESLSLLQAQVEAAQDSSDQIAGAAVLAHTQNPEAVDFLAASIQDQKFNPETTARLSYSPAAPDVFDRLLNSDAVSESQKVALLDTLAEHAVEGNSEVRAKLTDMLAAYLETADSPATKARAIRAIGALGEESAPEIMQSYFNSNDADLRKEAFFTFVNYTNPLNYDALFDFLWDEDQKVRRTAMVSLERFAGHEDVEMLEKAAQHDDEFIRKHANAVLRELNVN